MKKVIKILMVLMLLCGCGNQKISKESDCYYNVLDYGIDPSNEDNTQAMQALIDLVEANGGGTIYIPNGIYTFKGVNKAPWNDSMYTLMAKSNVSIVGENVEKTILKHESLASLFFHQGSLNNIISGCRYANFSVDAYDAGDENKVYGKVFFYQYVRNCLFENLILKGSVASALGIDYLDQVQIDNVTTIDCGRTYSGKESGSSGIGIGLGGFDNENFIIKDCITINSGQYGIFVENQHALGWGGHSDESQGMIITNCIVRNGKNKGIGIRGGAKVLIQDCLIYDNEADGIYLDGYCQDIKIDNCSIHDNKGNAFLLECNNSSHDLVFSNNMSVNNQGSSFHLNPQSLTKKIIIMNNYCNDHQQSLFIKNNDLVDYVDQNNVFIK